MNMLLKNKYFKTGWHSTLIKFFSKYLKLKIIKFIIHSKIFKYRVKTKFLISNIALSSACFFNLFIFFLIKRKNFFRIITKKT